MKSFLIGFVVAGALACPAYAAADKPVIGPAPAWVKPVAMPPSPAKPDEAAVRLLLSDQQVSLESGRQTIYSEFALRIQTPQGLAAGNISLPWSPDTDVLTVHKLLIRRGSQTIDVLASGQTFTVVRREQNLESATLDGILTANIQPEGLQVGDILEFATSISSSDPVLKGHVEQFAAMWNSGPISRAHMRMQWPSSLPIKLRQTSSLPILKPVKNGPTTVVELSLDNIEPILPPRGAPPRYSIGRLVEVSDFAAWGDLGALMAPLYAKAATLPAEGPLRTELEHIRSASSDPKTRAEAALALVQDRVRYVALSMGVGGYTPADAEVTWSRRYGDCKGKTALLLALLHALDIQAEPVAVNALSGDGIDARLPMAGLFNHVLVRATIAGRIYWLDGTRTGDTSLDRLAVPSFGWGLPLVANGAALVRIMPEPLDKPEQSMSIRIDATAGLTLPAPIKAEAILRGDDAITVNAGLANLTGEVRDRALKDYWKSQYDFVEPRSVSATFDPKTGEQRLLMEGVGTMDWSSGWYELDGVQIGYKADFSRDPGRDQDAPFAVPYPYYARAEETILLPPGFGYAQSGNSGDIDQTIAGITYHRSGTLEGATFKVEKTERSIAPEFPAKEAPEAQATLRRLAEDSLYLRKPPSYMPTEQEVQAALAATPTTSQAFVLRGNMLLDRGRYDEAIKDLDRANALDPKNIWALANRGLAYAWKENFEAAEKDLAAAESINPRNAVVLRARGMIAQKKGGFKEAAAAYSASLEVEPGNLFALLRRAETNRLLGNDEAALRDAATLLTFAPTMTDAYLTRANVFLKQGNAEEAMKEAAAVVAANPGSTYSYMVAAGIYSAFHKDADATKAYDRALEIKPEAYIYVNRSTHLPKADLTGRRADLDMALKLDPNLISALAARGELQMDSRDFAGAIATYNMAITKAPDDLRLQIGRGVAYARSGNMADADKDFLTVRSKATDPSIFNTMCWFKAKAGVALESALADCDMALSKLPDMPSYLDSRGLVLLRLGRVDDAIADYDRALAKNSRMSASLFGRAVAWSRKGDKPKSERDAAAAPENRPQYRRRLCKIGVSL